MTLEDASNLSQLIAAVAVIVSLIYAALQFRASAKEAREARLVTSLHDVQEFRRLLASDADCARIYRDGLASMRKLESIDQWRFGALMQMLVTSLYYSKELDVFGNTVHGSIREIIRRPGFQEWWLEGQRVFPTPMIKFVDEHLENFKASEPERQTGAVL